jgi:hypothetical protein
MLNAVGSTRPPASPAPACSKLRRDTFVNVSSLPGISSSLLESFMENFRVASLRRFLRVGREGRLWRYSQPQASRGQCHFRSMILIIDPDQ